MSDLLFGIEDIKPQFDDEQIKEVESIIYMAKETGTPQEFSVGGGQKIGVFPSGKMMKIKEKKSGNFCPDCGSKRVVDAPPFEDMTEQDKKDWKESGGEITLLDCSCGYSD